MPRIRGLPFTPFPWPTPEVLKKLTQHYDETMAEVQRVRTRDIETAAGFPSGYTMTVQLREALDLPELTEEVTPDSVLAAWEEALVEVRRLKGLA